MMDSPKIRTCTYIFIIQEYSISSIMKLEFLHVKTNNTFQLIKNILHGNHKY